MKKPGCAILTGSGSGSPVMKQAAQIIGLSEPDIAKKLVAHKQEMERKVLEKAEKIRQQLGKKS